MFNSLRTKLLAAFAVVCMFTAVVGVMATRSLDQTNKTLHYAVDNLAPTLDQVGRIRFYFARALWQTNRATSGLFAGEGHIPLACTPEPGSAAPVVGGVDPCQSEFIWANIVTRVHEDPRVTKPYSDTEWEAIDALGGSD